MTELPVTRADTLQTTPADFLDEAVRLNRWILFEGPRLTDVSAFIAALAPRLGDMGVPVYRVTSGIPMLHPIVRAETVVWMEGQDVTLRRHLASLETDQALKESPLHAVYYRGSTVRVPIPAEPAANEYGIVEDLRQDGATDYVALPVPAGNGYNSLTIATRVHGGFTDAMIELVESLLPAIGLVFELHTERRTAATLLDTYVGHRSASRVLSGEIRRGDGQAIDAVIYFSDLRNFTEITSRYPSKEVVEILNFYFDSVTDPVAEQGGEVLKFIGDAVLAIFPYETPEQARSAANRAVMAARQAQLNLANFCTTCYGDRLDRLTVGVALHAGEVFYGNVGGRERLDFTVIGEAVNVGSRISGLSRDLGHPVLVSKNIVDLATPEFVHAGAHWLKGVPAPQDVYYPAECEKTIREAERLRGIAAE